MSRIHVPAVLAPGDTLNLPASAARHVQVLRLQPGDQITLFNGGIEGALTRGGEFEATVVRMGRSEVEVLVGAHMAVEREASRAVHLVVGMPANERMDWLVEKATELGVVSIQPLVTERCVVRLSGERAEKKQGHWQSIAVAACEQCGRNRVPVIHSIKNFAQWAAGPLDAQGAGQLYLLSLQRVAVAIGGRSTATSASSSVDPVTFLSGPEGGLTEGEEDRATALGFVAASLGPRVLRAETAALAALTLLA